MQQRCRWYQAEFRKGDMSSLMHDAKIHSYETYVFIHFPHLFLLVKVLFNLSFFKFL